MLGPTRARAGMSRSGWMLALFLLITVALCLPLYVLDRSQKREWHYFTPAFAIAFIAVILSS